MRSITRSAIRQCPVSVVGSSLAGCPSHNVVADAVGTSTSTTSSFPSSSQPFSSPSSPFVATCEASIRTNRIKEGHYTYSHPSSMLRLLNHSSSSPFAGPSHSCSPSFLPPLHHQHQQRRCIVIETNETPNPDCLRFFSMELSFLPAGQSMDMPNNGHAYKSPLAEILFNLNGVKALYFADEYITVTKESTDDWAEVATMVKEAIAQFAESGVSILSAEGEGEILPTNWDTEPAEDDSEVVLAIKELLHARIRPMVQGDGGNVRFIGFDADDGMVYVMLEGACKACPSSGQTLKFGIERMLMHWIPEVTEVQEVDEDFAADYKFQQLQRLEEAKKKAEAEAEAADSGLGASNEQK